MKAECFSWGQSGGEARDRAPSGAPPGWVISLPGASFQISKVHSHLVGFLGAIRVDVCAVLPTLCRTEWAFGK